MQTPGPARFTRLLSHSQEARSGAWVATCRSCGAVHEVVAVDETRRLA
jgi:hypothetical protein